MILAITDGVGLTKTVSPAQPCQAARIFKNFFRAQIGALEKEACSHWRVVKTTGDGLIFTAVDDRKCTKNCTKSIGQRPCERVLLAIRHARDGLAEHKIKLRSVLHHCSDEKVLHGNQHVQIGRSTMVDEDAERTLASDIFGIEVIRLARIASIVKGPFHVITEGFAKQLVRPFAKGKPTDTPEKIADYLQRWNRKHTNIGRVEIESIPIPYLKGFDEEDMSEDDRISLNKPYHVWEMVFTDGRE